MAAQYTHAFRGALVFFVYSHEKPEDPRRTKKVYKEFFFVIIVVFRAFRGCI